MLSMIPYVLTGIRERDLATIKIMVARMGIEPSLG